MNAMKSILIKNGRFIDPLHQQDGIMDVWITDGKIAAIGPALHASADQEVDATGMMVVPGLVDVHAHHFYGTADRFLSNGPYAVAPDGFTFRSGVTTAVDFGGAGWKNIELFRRNVVERSKTRVLALINILGEGMSGEPWEQDIEDMDPEKTAKAAKENNDIVVGVKLAHYLKPEWTPTERTVEAGRIANIPVAIDFGGDDRYTPLSIEKLFIDKLRPGDIYTHVYADLKRREGIVDPSTGKLKPFVWEARKKGVLFDLGHGGYSFAYSQAIPALAEGFLPDAISTDLHTFSMNEAMKDMTNLMSKMLALGMTLNQVIKASTSDAAAMIRRPELGQLAVGAEADVAILSIREGKFGFPDVLGKKVMGTQKLECEVTIRGGEIVYDLNGLTVQ